LNALPRASRGDKGAAMPVSEQNAATDHRREKMRTQTLGRRCRQGSGHSPIEKRSSAIICRNYGERIPRLLKLPF
jgi:hypothetical protein